MKERKKNARNIYQCLEYIFLFIFLLLRDYIHIVILYHPYYFIIICYSRIYILVLHITQCFIVRVFFLNIALAISFLYVAFLLFIFCSLLFYLLKTLRTIFCWTGFVDIHFFFCFSFSSLTFSFCFVNFLCTSFVRLPLPLHILHYISFKTSAHVADVLCCAVCLCTGHTLCVISSSYFSSSVSRLWFILVAWRCWWCWWWCFCGCLDWSYTVCDIMEDHIIIHNTYE